MDVIRWATGDSGRQASERLAKMGLKVRREDGAQGLSWVELDNPKTIRKRYIYPTPLEFFEKDRIWLKFYEKDMLRLKVMWHRSGEPPFPNWLKQLISREQLVPI
jgi:hypothetical protein